MITPELLNYIKEQLAAGHSEETVRSELLKSGWDQEHVNEGLKAAKGGVTLTQEKFVGKVPHATQLFKISWAKYKEKFWVLVGIELVPIVLSSLSLPLLGHILKAYLLIPVMLVIVLVVLAAQIAMLYSIEYGYGVFKAYQIAFRNFFSFFWVNIITTACAVAFVAIPLVLYFSSLYLKSLGRISEQTYGAVTLACVLLYLVGALVLLFWLVRLGLSNYIIVKENVRGFNALARSNAYMKGNVRKFWFRLFILAVPIWVFTTLATTVGKSFPANLQQILPAIVNVLVVPFSIIYVYQIYLALKDLNPSPVIVVSKLQRTLFITALVVAVIAVTCMVTVIYKIGFAAAKL